MVKSIILPLLTNQIFHFIISTTKLASRKRLEVHKVIDWCIVIRGFGLCGWLFGYFILNGLKSTAMVKYKFWLFTRIFTVFLICT